MKYWTGKVITELLPNQIFVFGSNPEGRHGMGAAKAAIKFGAKYGKGRGLHGQTYALVTKNLTAGFCEKDIGLTYCQAGKQSVPMSGYYGIIHNIKELYEVARANPDKDFIVVYQNSSNNLNGYSPKEIIEAFMCMEVPDNIVLHDSFEEKVFKVVVAGGRDFKDFNLLCNKLDGLLILKAKTHKIVIVSGEAQGADKFGEDYAKLRGFKVEPHPAKWSDLTVEGAVIKTNKHGQYNAVAGHMRNEDMAISCDVGVLFWDGYSTGTADMKTRLDKHGKPCRIVEY